MNYQDKINDFRLPTYSPEAAVLGFMSEAGEVAGVFTRLVRGDFNQEEARNKLFLELGDCLFNLACICNDNGWSLKQVMDGNIEKLEGRKLRNAILGEGDSR